MPGKILVINGHGARISGKSVMLDRDNAIITPGIASDSFSINFDNQEMHLEQKTHQGKIWPITEAESGAEAQWTYYDSAEVPDIAITPLDPTFSFTTFLQKLKDGNTGWNDLTDPPHDPLARGAMAISKYDGTVIMLEGKELAEFVDDFYHNLVHVGQPMFYCDKKLGKIKPLKPTSLGEIYTGLKLIKEFKETGTSLVIATCSPDAATDMKAMTVQTTQPAMTFEKLFETELKVTSAKKLVDPEECRPKTQAAKVEPIATGIFTSRISMYAGPITDIAIEPGKKGAVATTKFSDLTKYFGCDEEEMIQVDLAIDKKESHKEYIPEQSYAISQASVELKKSHNIDHIELIVETALKGNSLENMFYEALVHSKDLDYIIFPVIKSNNNYDEYARFAINAFRRFIQDYPSSRLKIIFNTNDKLNAEKPYEEYAKLIEVAMGTDFEKVTSDLEHGPRQKTQATKDLETICKALLADPDSISCNFNVMDEMEVTLGNAKYNLTRILKNADFEQLEFSDEEVAAYAYFINYKAEMKPVFQGSDEVPTEEMYLQRDPANRHKDLSYGEKLAITLYSGDHMYRDVNRFLRNDGTLSLASNLVGEVLLVSAMATRGLSKVATRGLTIQDDSQSDYLKQTFYSPPIREPIFRTEKPSTFDIKRQTDIKKGRVTQQKGFTSTSERTGIGLSGALRPVKLVINTVRRPGLNIQHVAELCWNSAEMEVMYPPGSEFKYYDYKSEANQDVAHGIPVRTIALERQYQYGTEKLRLLRGELLNDITILLASDKFTEAMSYFLLWLRLLNLSEPELKFFDDICQFINSKLPKKLKDPWSELQKIKNLDENLFSEFLTRAAEYNSIEFIKTVLLNYPNANLVPAGKSLLMVAIQHNSVEVARYLLERDKISDEEAMRLLDKAVDIFHPPMVQMLVVHGFNVTKPLGARSSAITQALDKFFKKNKPKYIDAICSPKTAYALASAIFQLPDDKKRIALQAAVVNQDFLKIITEPDFGLRLAEDDISRQRSIKTQAVVAALMSGQVSDLGFFYTDGPTDKDLLEILKHSLELDATDLLAFEMIIPVLFTYITKQDAVPDNLSESLDMILKSEWFARQDAKDKREIIFNMQTVNPKLYAKWILIAAKADPEMLEQIKSSIPRQLTTVLLALTGGEFELAKMLWLPEFKDYIINHLYLAIAKNDSEKLRSLASLGVDATYRFPDGENLLHLALKRGHYAVVRNLLHAEQPPDVNDTSSKGETPFSLAVKNVLNSTDDDRQENIDLVCELLKSGAKINVGDLDKLSHSSLHDLVSQLGSNFDEILKNRGAEYFLHEPKVFIFLLLNAGSKYELTDEVKKIFNTASTIEKLEETVVGIIKSLPNDSAMRAEYISKLKDSTSPIATFINSISGPQASPMLFTTKSSNSIENILSKLEVKASTLKPSGSTD